MSSAAVGVQRIVVHFWNSEPKAQSGKCSADEPVSVRYASTRGSSHSGKWSGSS